MNLLQRFLRHREPKRPPDAASSGLDGLTPSMFAPLSAHRAPTGTQAVTLNPVARKWLDALPRKVRPLQLAERHPRLINQISLCWRDQRLTDRVLASLIVDQRGGRQGFPPPILAELMNLRDFHGERSVDEPDAVWAETTLATVDR